jgi:guanylate kinase
MSPAYSPNEVQRRGLMMILSSPSGAGKTTISRELLELEKNLSLSISTTTRPMRPGETNGKDYVFADMLDFKKMAERGEFLEHAKVFGNYYGTPRAPVEAALASGRDVMFDIDWQGTQQLVEKSRDDVVSVFILPPSWHDLEKRLHTRGQDGVDEIGKRMGKAADEMSHWAEYDYVIVNRDLKASIDAVQAILHSERLKRRRQIGLAEFVKGLTQGK